MAQAAFKFKIHGLKETMDALEQLPTVAMQKAAVRKALEKAAEPVKDAAVINAKSMGTGGAAAPAMWMIAKTIKIGTLKKSQQHRHPRTTVARYVGASHPLCIFGSGTMISVKGGCKKVGSVKAGDEVITQTGEYRKVVAVQSFPATLKPNIVEIKTGKHALNVTEDHKLLIFRDGRNKWVPAGELLETDRMYVRKKIGSNKGTGKIIVCQNCGKEFRSGINVSTNRKFCSKECMKEALQGKLIVCECCGKLFRSNGKIGRQRIYCSRDCRNNDFREKRPHLGLKRSEEAKKKMSKRAKTRYLLNPESHPNRIMCKKGYQTEHEMQIEAWLKERGLKYEKQKRIGYYYVDFYVPETKTIYEADGAYWHKNQAKDIKRDAGIKKVMPGAKIIHVHFYDERHSPKNMDKAPLPGVHYVACNPGTDSYTNPEMLETENIVSVKKWRYEQPQKGASNKLYDISVEGVHSFFASGLLVSNSHLFEFGTAQRFTKKGAYRGFIPTMPFLRQAWDAKKAVALGLLKDALWVEIAKAARRLAKKAERGTLTAKQKSGLMR